jgi:DNA polymerase
MKYVVSDFETASRIDLKKVGAWKYAADATTFPLCLSLKVVIDKKPQRTRVLTEKQMHARDAELMALANDLEVIFIAHNAGFEQAMWKFHMVPMGYPELPPERWHDTMAVAGMKALPLGLDALVTALELPVKKDMDGHRHMLIMCKPDRDGGWSHHNEYNLNRLGDYCGDDAEAQYGVYVSTQGLGPSERHTWVLDQRINQRGIRVDTEFVNACIDVLNQVRVPMVERFHELTGLKPTQREKVLNWVNDQGIALGDMKKATLDAILDPDDEFGIEDFGEPLPYHVHEVLTLRRSLASSSVAKLQRMLDCAGGDGRVRYATQYHGARTGRDAGRLIQIQNYPRGEIGDRQGLTADILADAILTRDVGLIREIWGPDIFTAVISSLRSCIVPEKGKVLVAGDFAAVEARNLLSMAGQHDRVEQMHAGLDVYSETASMIFRRPINRKDPAQAKEGQIGKNTVLGCLAAPTQVLTSNGWKAIVDVRLEDLLWDGIEWVTHNGLAFKGFKETLNISGLRLTTDHAVFDGVSWFRADEATEAKISQALAYAKGHGPCLGMPTPNLDIFMGLSANAIVGQAQNLWKSIIFAAVVLKDAMSAPRKNQSTRSKRSIGDTRKFVRMTQSGHVCSIVFPLSNLGVALAAQANSPSIMQVEVFEYGRNGIPQVRDGVLDRRNLSASFSRIYSLLKVGMIRLWKSTVSTTIKAMSREIYDLRQNPKMLRTSGKFLSCKADWMKRSKKSKCCEPVYDLVNAGPRNRFTVMTSDGPLIVHNSGYGLGPVGFRARFAPKDSIDLAMLAINTYRREFAPKVPKFWYGLWDASVSAVYCDHAKTYSYEGIEFRKENDFLTMRLPSGRKIWYHRPRKAISYTPSGDERPSWTFMSYQGKKFRRHLAWHGMLTADCIQGSARDLMVEAMKRAEAAGLNTVFKVHDELVFEEFDRPDICQVVKQVMEDISPWAIERRFRVKAEVDKMVRYRK